MSWHRLAAIARKELIQIWRDSRSLGIVLVMPLAMMLLFGYGVNLDMKHIPVCVFDREGSQQSQDLLKRFQSSEYFNVVFVVDSYPALVRAIDSDKARVGLVVPHDFSERLRTGETASVQAIVDATDDNTANLAVGYTQSVVSNFSDQVQVDWLRQQGRPEPKPPISVDARTWFNEDLESRAFIVPGVLALVMSVIGAFLTSLTIAREWERGTMEQLISTPVTPLEIMLGKLAPYFVIGMVNTGICAAVGIWWFQVPFRGSMPALFISSALFMMVVLGLGFFISVIGKSQLAASQMALVATFLPAFLLSGFLFSIEQMPVVIRAITHVVPARYFVTILKSVFLKGSGLALLEGELLALALFAAGLALLATHSFRKRL
ncbi:MAG TPA: ABC transporter permease [Terriglobales bacterium]|nr:ABC transporter permease [Terriglobales bacterium]